MICPNCGKELRKSASYCSYCGTQTSKSTAKQATRFNGGSGNQLKLKKKRRGRPLLVLAGIAALIVVFLAAFLLTGRAMRTNSIKKQIELGNRYLSELYYEQAVASYEAALKIDPKNADALQGLTDVYMSWSLSYEETGDYDNAEKVLWQGESFLREYDGAEVENLRVARETLLIKMSEVTNTQEPDIEADSMDTEGDNNPDLYGDAEAGVRGDKVEIGLGELPDQQEMEALLSAFYWYLRTVDTVDSNDANTAYYDCRTVADGENNLLYRIMFNIPCFDTGKFPFMNAENFIEGNDPLGIYASRQFSQYARYDAREVDLIAKNVFHCTDDDILALRIKGEETHLGQSDPYPLFYYYDGNYYRMDAGLGGPYGPATTIERVEYDGICYYVTYEILITDGFDYAEPYGRFDAIMGYDNKDGASCWSIYKCTPTS